MAKAKTGAVAVKGLKELQRAFARAEEDVANDLVMALQEAAEPVRLATQQYIVSGGGGFPGMSGVARRDASYWSGMKIGVSKRQGMVWIAPAWSSNKGTLQGQILAVQYRWRMEGALEDKGRDIEQRLDKMIDEAIDAWERF